MQAAARSLRIALVQFKGGINKTENVQRACDFIRRAVKDHSPKVVALPECFNSPYGTKYFEEYAEIIPTGETSCRLSEIAKELGVYIVGGTIPERADNKIYNTCTIWSPTGNLINTYRKVHLFDIDVKGGIRFKESDVLSAGDSLTVIEIDGIKIGLGICYDIRFEELARIYRNKGCEVLLYPGAFNMTTGPMHWELLARARANDNQLYVATISPARDVNAGYVAWGHSMIVDPWGKIVQSATEDEGIVAAELDLNLVSQVRQQIPVGMQRRHDLYETVEK